MQRTSTTVGEILRSHRLRLKLTQQEVADRAGLSVRALRTIEQGGGRPRASSVRRLAAALGLSAAESDHLLSATGPVTADGLLCIDVLGPLAVRRGEVPIDVRATMQRALVGLLALHRGQRVSHSDIVDVLWGDRPPRSGLNQVHVHVGRLRTLLEPAREPWSPGTVIVRSREGYALSAKHCLLDLGRFDDLVARARADGEPETTYTLLLDALRCWRGPVLADGGERLRQHPAALALHRRRVEAAATFGDAAATLGRYDQSVPILRDIVHEEPLHEGLHARLMVALAGAGEQAAALAVFVEIRERLADELGVEPGAEIREAHVRILRQEIPSRRSVSPANRSVTPAQLPLDVYGFAGRQAELARLDEILAKADNQPTAVVISAVWGTAGVGKTALAVHWAHRVHERFPDGQLYVNMRGFDPGGLVMEPAEAVRRFLDALGVPAQRIPASVDAQVDLYRSMLAGRRVLVVLDNIRDASQVRPLLPGSPGCLAVVTSRNDLAGLVAGEGAQPLALDVLPVAEARDLLARRLGETQVRAQPLAVHQIIEQCARLPLALAVVAARAAGRGEGTLDALAAELRSTPRSLELFSGVDAATNVRQVFSWSYHTLTEDGARIFRLLGLHPGPDISIAAAASLAGLPAPRTRRLLAELTSAHLLNEHVAGRYTFHDLLRAYAHEQVQNLDSEEERTAASHRTVDHYLHSAYGAARRLDPHRGTLDLAPPPRGVIPESLGSHEHALAWFVAEQAVLQSAVNLAYQAGFHSQTWQMTWALVDFLGRRGLWREHVAVGSAALAAAQRLGDRSMQARAHHTLANAYTRLDNFDDANRHLEQGLDLHRRIGDKEWQANTLLGLASAKARQRRYSEALAYASEALHLVEALDDQRDYAVALNAVGWYHALLGNYDQTVAHCERALAIQQEIDDLHGVAGTWDSLGYAHHHLGHHTESVTCYGRALELFRNLGDRYYESDSLVHLGEAYHTAGEMAAARGAWEQASAILEDIDHPEVEQVRNRLRDLKRVSPAREHP